MGADPATDPELVAEWRRGDELAAGHLVRRHAAALGRYLAAAGAPSADMEDLVQDTFFKAFRGLDGWRGDGSFRGWLFRIAGNLLKDRFRQNKGRIFLEIEEQDIASSTDPAGELAGMRLDGCCRKDCGGCRDCSVRCSSCGSSRDLSMPRSRAHLAARLGRRGCITITQ